MRVGGGGRGGEGGGGGDGANIKSNNSHLTGGEQRFGAVAQKSKPDVTKDLTPQTFRILPDAHDLGRQAVLTFNSSAKPAVEVKPLWKAIRLGCQTGLDFETPAETPAANGLGVKILVPKLF